MGAQQQHAQEPWRARSRPLQLHCERSLLLLLLPLQRKEIFMSNEQDRLEKNTATRRREDGWIASAAAAAVLAAA
jgi:hypothetical protein